MRLRSVPRVSFVAALLVGLASPSSAADSPDAEASRLDDHHYFVKELDRGWEPLLADIDKTIEALGKSSPERLLVIRDATRETVAEKSLKTGVMGEARALELFDRLANEAVDASKRTGFHKRCADILMAQADRAERVGDDKHDAEALELANKALVHVPAFAPAIGVIGRVGFKVGKVSMDHEDYDAADTQFKQTLKTLRSSGAKDDDPQMKAGIGFVDQIAKTTGTWSVTWLGDAERLAAVKGPKTDFRQAVVSFSAGSVKPPPKQTADKPRRMRAGTWQVTATGVGAGLPVTATLTVAPDRAGSLTMIPVVPDGMVFVPAAGDDEAFLIDRTEVSNQQYQAMTGQARSGAPEAAVAGISFADASKAAAAAGKRLPSHAQWTHAAFGAPMARRPRYPWGDQPGQPGRQFVAGKSEAQSVESCPDGRSACGCLNMCGNVWEWIDVEGGWLIGFGWDLESLSDLDAEMPWPPGTTAAPWKADLLRDPIPSPDGYGAIKSPEERRKYSQNIATADGALAKAGFRCVVVLGKSGR